MIDELAEMRVRAEKAEARWLDAERADTEKAHRIAVLEGELFAARLANDEARELLADVVPLLRGEYDDEIAMSVRIAALQRGARR